MSSNPHLEEARAEMERARRDAEEAKRVYNQKAKSSTSGSRGTNAYSLPNTMTGWRWLERVSAHLQKDA